MWKAIVSEGETRFGPDYTWLDLSSRHALEKVAGVGVHVPPALEAKVAELRDTIPEGKVAFYNRALGSFEAFGLNRNGDGFSRHELETKHDTFVKNAHYFRHHQNRDPAMSRGRPVASAFNDQTDMIDLIIVADMDKCAEQINALESGKRVPTSMGAKVAFDTCTICDHAAKRRDDYCQHVHKLAQAPYGMRSVLSDGRVCGVMNPDPKWFDLSDVIMGAAPESETLLKVASMAGNVSGAEFAEILGLANLGDKQAAITKRIPGVIEGSPILRRGFQGMSEHETPIPDEVIDSARDAGGFDGVLRNSAALGIVLSPSEFSRAAKLGSFTAPTIEEIYASEPMPKKVLASALDSDLMSRFSNFFEKRSAFMPTLLNRVSDLGQKIASAAIEHDDENARLMYGAYRRSLIDTMPGVGEGEGEFWVMKCAETTSRMFGDSSRAYVDAAFLSPSTDVMDKILDRVVKIAQPSHVTTDLGKVSGTIAEQIGVETLDLIAVQSLRNKAG